MLAIAATGSLAGGLLQCLASRDYLSWWSCLAPAPVRRARERSKRLQRASSCGLHNHSVAFGGPNIKVIGAQSLNVTACCAACDAMPTCVGWTLHHGQRRCWLKSSLLPVRMHRAISGYRPGATILSTNLTDVFSRVYDSKRWSDAGLGSGPGSDFVNAQGAARILYHVALLYNVTSMIDAPCGAMEWQPQVLYQLKLQLRSFRYLGLDIVPSVVRSNQRLHEREPPFTPGKYGDKLDLHATDFMQFRVADLTASALPHGYDLIMSRDGLQHNSYDGIFTILLNMAATDARYLLLGSYTTGKNWDIGPSLDHRPGTGFKVDLAKPPFSLTPSAVYRENYGSKSFYLYERPKFKQMLDQSYAAQKFFERWRSESG